MVRSSLVSVLIALVLCACGGGGSGSSGGNSSSLDAQSSYTAATPTVNDFYTYKNTLTSTPYGASAPTSNTRFFTDLDSVINSDGSYVQTVTSSNSTYTRVNRNFTASGGMISAGSCVYSPAWIKVPATLSVGLTWENTASRTCPSEGQVISKGSVVGIEPVTVPAGTFSAFKLAYTTTYKTGAATTVNDLTCWWEATFGRNLKCAMETTNTSGTSPSTVSKSTESWELVGYANAKSSQQKLAVERYAGAWSGSYSGQLTGSCTAQISTDGTLSGSCSDGTASSFNINGTVNAQGNLTFSLNAGGVTSTTFNATSVSSLTIAGTWSTSTGLNGTWSMSHN